MHNERKFGNLWTRPLATGDHCVMTWWEKTGSGTSVTSALTYYDWSFEFKSGCQRSCTYGGQNRNSLAVSSFPHYQFTNILHFLAPPPVIHISHFFSGKKYPYWLAAILCNLIAGNWGAHPSEVLVLQCVTLVHEDEPVTLYPVYRWT